MTTEETGLLTSTARPARRAVYGMALAAVAVVAGAGVWRAQRGASLEETAISAASATDDATTDDIASQDSAANAPHILLVTLDDAGWNDFGYQSSDLYCSADDPDGYCSNHSYSVTPHMDSLAGAGVKLTGLYGQASIRASTTLDNACA